jgi:hypothetical protein
MFKGVPILRHMHILSSNLIVRRVLFSASLQIQWRVTGLFWKIPKYTY